MKVLVLADFTAAPCGIRNYADMIVGGLRHHGVAVTPWNVHYPLVYARREAGEPTYLPDDWATYDVIYLNWHPIALNTYGPGHFPWPKGTGPLVSVYLNDIPPWSGCPVAERAEVIVAPEPFGEDGKAGPDLLQVYPIVDWVTDLPAPAPAFTVGWSGVRGDGAALLRGLCTDKNWAMNMTEPPTERTLPWVSVEDEIRRLARSTVNVCWYHQQRGIAGTPSVALGTHRPLLLNDSAMFAPWWAAEAPGLYLACERDGVSLEDALTRVYRDWHAGQLQTPAPSLYTAHSWATATAQLTAAWTAALEAR
jgi:hypothetical protein